MRNKIFKIAIVVFLLTFISTKFINMYNNDLIEKANVKIADKKNEMELNKTKDLDKKLKNEDLAINEKKLVKDDEVIKNYLNSLFKVKDKKELTLKYNEVSDNFLNQESLNMILPLNEVGLYDKKDLGKENLSVKSVESNVVSQSSGSYTYLSLISLEDDRSFYLNYTIDPQENVSDIKYIKR